MRAHVIDLTDADPSRCGLAWDPAELEALHRSPAGAADPGEQARELLRAREAIASYLAGRGASISPERIALTSSTTDALSLLLDVLCGVDDEVLVPLPGSTLLDDAHARGARSVTTYRLAYDGEWRLDRKSLLKALGRRTRAVVVGNPSEPTGAILPRDDEAFVERTCAERGLALILDETFADAAPSPSPALDPRLGLAFRVSGLSGVCGLPGAEVAWVAAAGPDAVVQPVLERLERRSGHRTAAPSGIAALPALLARRERFAEALRARLAGNRTSLASAALREAPWAVEGGRGGRWAVLQVGAAQEEEALCRSLLDDGVVVHPGSRFGLPPSGYLVVSLLPPPDVFREGLARLDRRLRAPMRA